MRSWNEYLVAAMVSVGDVAGPDVDNVKETLGELGLAPEDATILVDAAPGTQAIAGLAVGLEIAKDAVAEEHARHANVAEPV